nr:MAG TPA: HNH endonuclease [Caudoviricetes sp.]
MERYYFTFGVGIDKPHRCCYHVIEAASYEQAHGPIPKGHCVQFKDGDTLNCVLDNLYLISRKKQVRKNFDDMPAERKADVRKRIQETRNKRIKADRLRLRWGLETKGRLIKRIQR